MKTDERNPLTADELAFLQKQRRLDASRIGPGDTDYKPPPPHPSYCMHDLERDRCATCAPRIPPTSTREIRDTSTQDEHIARVVYLMAAMTPHDRARCVAAVAIIAREGKATDPPPPSNTPGAPGWSPNTAPTIRPEMAVTTGDRDRDRHEYDDALDVLPLDGDR